MGRKRKQTGSDEIKCSRDELKKRFLKTRGVLMKALYDAKYLSVLEKCCTNPDVSLSSAAKRGIDVLITTLKCDLALSVWKIWSDSNINTLKNLNGAIRALPDKLKECTCSINLTSEEDLVEKQLQTIRNDYLAHNDQSAEVTISIGSLVALLDHFREMFNRLCETDQCIHDLTITELVAVYITNDVYESCQALSVLLSGNH